MKKIITILAIATATWCHGASANLFLDEQTDIGVSRCPNMEWLMGNAPEVVLNLTPGQTNWVGVVTKRTTNFYGGISVIGQLKGRKTSHFVISGDQDGITGSIYDGQGRTWPIGGGNQMGTSPATEKRALAASSLKGTNATQATPDGWILFTNRPAKIPMKRKPKEDRYTGYNTNGIPINNATRSKQDRFIPPEPTNDTIISLFIYVAGNANGYWDFYFTNSSFFVHDYWPRCMTNTVTYWYGGLHTNQVYTHVHDKLTYPQAILFDKALLQRIDTSIQEANVILANNNTHIQLQVKHVYNATNGLIPGLDLEQTGVMTDGTPIYTRPDVSSQMVKFMEIAEGNGWLDQNDVVIAVSRDEMSNTYGMSWMRWAVNVPPFPEDDVVPRVVWVDERQVNDGKYSLLHEIGHCIGLDHNQEATTPSAERPFAFGTGYRLAFTNSVWVTNITATDSFTASSGYGHIRIPAIDFYGMYPIYPFDPAQFKELLVDFYPGADYFHIDPPNWTTQDMPKAITNSDGTTMAWDYYVKGPINVKMVTAYTTNVQFSTVQKYHTIMAYGEDATSVRIPYFSGTNTFEDPYCPGRTRVLQDTTQPREVRQDNARAIRLVAPYVGRAGSSPKS